MGLEQGDRGSTRETTVHIAYAATEKKRRRDYRQLFYSALREALIGFRTFAVVFGPVDPQGRDTLPPSWALSEFFDAHNFPVDLFDLDHFHSSGAVGHFLPPEKRCLMCPSPAPMPPEQNVTPAPEVAEPKVPDGKVA